MNIEQLKTKVLESSKMDKIRIKKHAEVFTPFSLINEMLDKLPEEVWSNPDLKWLDPANGVGNFPAIIVQRLMKGLEEHIADEDERYKHIMEKMIYVCDLQPKNMFLYQMIFNPRNNLKLNAHRGSFLEPGFPDDIWPGVKKFDIVVGNPPYNASLDLKFVKKIIEDIKPTYFTFVHPSTYLLDMKDSSRFTSTKKLLKDHLEEVKLFNGNKMFGIGLFVPCAIIYWNKNYSGLAKVQYFDDSYEADVFNITKFGAHWDPTVKAFKDKIEHYCIKHGNFWDNRSIECRKEKPGKFYIQLAAIRGNVIMQQKAVGSKQSDKKLFKDDFFTVIMKDPEKNKGIRKSSARKDRLIVYEFNTEEERNNCIAYCKTDFFRFCLALLKNNADIGYGEMTLIPWLDFTKKWSDEELYKKFEVSETLQRCIGETVDKYY